jgi:hypothetical protein
MSTKNEFADVRFKVCEYGDGTPYIGTYENGPKTNSILHEYLALGFQLNKGISHAEAQNIVEYLNRYIIRVTATTSN